jgi:hypothetical protein
MPRPDRAGVWSSCDLSPAEVPVDLLTPLAFAGGTLVLAALAAGFVDRAPLSFPMVFLGLGLVLGDGATGRCRWTSRHRC